MRLNRFYFDQAISIDNALTTNQIIHQLITQINKIIDTINGFETDAHKYTDLKVGELRVELNNQVERLEDLIDSRENILRALIYEKSAEAENNAKSYTDAELEVLKSDYIQPIVQEIYNTIRLIENRLDAKIDAVDTRLTNLIEETKAELIDLIKKGGAVYSGYSGLLTSIQKEIHQLYSVYSNFFGLTWNIFDNYFNNVTTCYESLIVDTNNTPASIISAGNDKYHFKYTSNTFKFSIVYTDEDKATIIVKKTTGNLGSINAVRLCNTLYSDNVVKNTDNNELHVSNIPISSLDYSYLTFQIGTYEGETFNAINFFVFSKINTTDAHRVKITWNTIQYLIDKNVNINYDFINYYFYSDFGDVLGSVLLTNDIQYGLNNTLLNFNRTQNAPNNCSVGTQFGQNNVPFLNNTIDYFAQYTKNRKVSI